METLKTNTTPIRQQLTRQLAAAFGSLAFRYGILLVGVATLGWLCSNGASSQTIRIPDQVLVLADPPPAKDQSFEAPYTGARELTREQGWTPEHPRMLADVNGDGRQDIVGFGRDGVWVVRSIKRYISGVYIDMLSPSFVLANFGYQSGWRATKHVRVTGDINGDKLDDVVGFGEAGVYRSLSSSTGFGPVTFVIADLGYQSGWRVDKHVRLLADVNGDGRKDIVAFGEAGVWLSLADAAGNFSAPAFVLAELGYNQGWRPAKHIRTTADVNGDGKQDIVGFGDDGVWLALSTGNGFGPARFVLADFGYEAGGWTPARHPRLLADVNRDGRQDIVGFGYDGVWTARSTGNGFAAAQFVLADFGYNQGWRVGSHTQFVDGTPRTQCTISSCEFGANPRFVADLNGDGYQDIVGFGDEAIYRSLGGPGGFGPPRAMLRALVIEQGHPWNGFSDVVLDFYPRLVGDINGDGKHDLIAFDTEEIKLVRSSDQAPPPPPAAPSNARVTSATTTSLSIAWNDNSSNERKFFVTYGKSGTGSTKGVNDNITSTVLSGLSVDTQYCFSVQAENIFGFSAPSQLACGRTKKETPQPTPTPAPTPVQGISQINVFNCNVNKGAVHIWTFDATLGIWEQRGTLAAQYDSGGSCPGTAAPLVVTLKDGHTYHLVAVDPQLPVCGVNDPSFSACQRSLLGPLKGNAKGPALRHVVN